MARSGFSTSNFLTLSSGLLTAVPLTMACWASTSVAGTAQSLMILQNSANASLNSFQLAVSATNAIIATTADGTSPASAGSSVTVTTNTLFHACAVFASITDRRAFLNGGSKGTNATSKTPSGINRTNLGVANGSSVSQPLAPSGTGLLAEAAIWNIVLADTDVAALAKGLSPLLMHPEALVAYWPLIGNNSPENNLKSNSAAMSITGSLTKSAHPPIFMPRSRSAA